MSTESKTPLRSITNVSARLFIFAERYLLEDKKRNRTVEKKRDFRLIPGETREVSQSLFDRIMAGAFAASGGIQEGTVKMPKGRVPDLAKADIPTACRIIAGEKDPATLKIWAKGEARGEVLVALSTRAKELAS